MKQFGLGVTNLFVYLKNEVGLIRVVVQTVQGLGEVPKKITDTHLFRVCVAV